MAKVNCADESCFFNRGWETKDCLANEITVRHWVDGTVVCLSRIYGKHGDWFARTSKEAKEFRKENEGKQSQIVINCSLDDCVYVLDGRCSLDELTFFNTPGYGRRCKYITVKHKHSLDLERAEVQRLKEVNLKEVK